MSKYRVLFIEKGRYLNEGFKILERDNLEDLLERLKNRYGVKRQCAKSFYYEEYPYLFEIVEVPDE